MARKLEDRIEDQEWLVDEMQEGLIDEKDEMDEARMDLMDALEGFYHTMKSESRIVTDDKGQRDDECMLSDADALVSYRVEYEYAIAEWKDTTKQLKKEKEKLKELRAQKKKLKK